MSKNPEDTPGSVEQLPNTQPKAPQLGRRLFILKATAILGVVGASALGIPREAQAKDFGSGHQDPAGKHGEYDGGLRRHGGKHHGGKHHGGKHQGGKHQGGKHQGNANGDSH